LVGVIGAAGVLTAIVPCSMILMTAATLLANNVYRVARRSADDAHVVSVAKALVPVIALVAVLFTLEGGQTIVALLLLGYALVIQLFPAFVCSLPARRWVTRAGAASGMLSGIATVAAIALTHTTIGTLFPTLPVGIKEINVGIVALAVNVAVMLSVTAAARLAPAGAS
jgi:SSS family solute:Na+ symporter